jgi:hypothetical protein
MVLRVAFPYLTSAAAVAWMLGTGLAAAGRRLAPRGLDRGRRDRGGLRGRALCCKSLRGGARHPVGPIKPGAAPRTGDARPADPRLSEPRPAEGKQALKKAAGLDQALVALRRPQGVEEGRRGERRGGVLRHPRCRPSSWRGCRRTPPRRSPRRPSSTPCGRRSATRAWSRPAPGRRARGPRSSRGGGAGPGSPGCARRASP